MNDRRPTLSLDDASVNFLWTGDRFAHEVRLGDRVVARSIEGDGDQDFPPSPPIQDLSIETLDMGKAALGVGGAGRGHWSISVLIRDGGFDFDIACRHPDAIDHLGSRYEIIDSRGWSAGSQTERDDAGFKPTQIILPMTRWSYRWEPY